MTGQTSGGMPRLTIAGASSGVGKTTLTAGLLAVLRGRGLKVQPFKAGPDYIDPTYHTLAAGRPCRNLDAWMLQPPALRASFTRACRDADLAVVEGVMGLFDGFGYDDDEGSTAHLARLIDSPVVVVLNAAAMGRSAGALALGYARYDPGLKVAGFIANNVGGPAHGRGVAHAITCATGLPCFGWLPRSLGLQIPERHLGLIPTAEPGGWETFIAAAAAHVAEYLDVDGLLALAAQAGQLAGSGPVGSPAPAWDTACSAGDAPTAKPLIAVARDEAFSFYYEDNLEMLQAAGAELAFFSPLHDNHLPAGARGLYLGGGFPEIYAAQLSANAAMRSALGDAIAGGLPTYAECGGLMYLTESVTDTEGQVRPMIGALPGRSAMTPRLTMGYRTLTVARATWLAPAGLALRGHEFHYSDWIDRPAHAPAAYSVAGRHGEPVRAEGYAQGNVIASYIHLHFGAAPELAARLVAACA